MRIVGGRFRGRTLAGPQSNAIRPTSDRLRESLFNILEHRYGDVLEGARVIDLFAGTGALGLEALSRGGVSCLFVEEAAEARALIQRNIETLGLTGATRLFRRDATKLGPAPAGQPYTLAFLDPPYARELAGPALAALASGGWLAPGALVVVEEAAEAPVPLPDGMTALDRRVMAETQLVFATVGSG